MKWMRIFQIVLFISIFFLTSVLSFAQGKQVVVIPLDSGMDGDWHIAGDDIYNKNIGNVGVGVSTPGEKLHLAGGNFLIEGGGETAVLIKRDVSFDNELKNHYHRPFINPIFKIGRIIEGGDGAPQFRWMYQDDTHDEHVVMELDSEGIMSSVRWLNNRGSHFEGHLEGDSHPLFRLNSAPDMQLQMGPGGEMDTDVALTRMGNNKIAIKTNDEIRLTVDENGNVGIATTSPSSKLAVTGLPSGIDDNVVNGNLAGAVCITDTGNFYIDTDGSCNN